MGKTSKSQPAIIHQLLFLIVSKTPLTVVSDVRITAKKKKRAGQECNAVTHAAADGRTERV